MKTRDIVLVYRRSSMRGRLHINMHTLNGSVFSIFNDQVNGWSPGCLPRFLPSDTITCDQFDQTLFDVVQSRWALRRFITTEETRILHNVPNRNQSGRFIWVNQRRKRPRWIFQVTKSRLSFFGVHAIKTRWIVVVMNNEWEILNQSIGSIWQPFYTKRCGFASQLLSVSTVISKC